MPQNRLETGRFQPGRSGNPGGRPKGLTRTARELIGDDGRAIIEFWISVMTDLSVRTSDRLEASRLLAERGWGKAADQQPLEDVNYYAVSRQQVEIAVQTFNAEVKRLSALHESQTAPAGVTDS
jgi:hypothetical protein